MRKRLTVHKNASLSVDALFLLQSATHRRSHDWHWTTV